MSCWENIAKHCKMMANLIDGLSLFNRIIQIQICHQISCFLLNTLFDRIKSNKAKGMVSQKKPLIDAVLNQLQSYHVEG